MTDISPELQAKFRNINILALDVDGVLTDGGVYIGEDGKEFRKFNIKDGAGIKQVIDKGIIVVIISSSPCKSIMYRATQLGIEEVHIGVADKLKELTTICLMKNVELSEVCYIGDDLADLPAMQAVGLACAPKDSVEEVIEIAVYITQTLGGKGCVREICDILDNLKN
jgi:3-deoxy-D-manno-octulosonate 8-phosphate phosphatase (KDO 8-P phosphatase)